MSVTVVIVVFEVFPLSSVAVAKISSPPSSSTPVGISIVKFPWSFAVPVAVVPSGNVTVTSEPGSAWPVTWVASLVTSFTVGASGAVASTTVVSVLSDSFPDSSLVLAVMFSPPTRFKFEGISIV